MLEIRKGRTQRPLAMGFDQPGLPRQALAGHRGLLWLPSEGEGARSGGGIGARILLARSFCPQARPHVHEAAGGPGSLRHVAHAPQGARCGLVKVGGLGSLSPLDN